METSTFEKVQQQLQTLIAGGDYASALEIATRAVPYFPEFAHILAYWRSAMAARLGDAGQAIQTLEEINRTGFWYGQRLLRNSPSFQSLQGNPDFERVIAANAELQDEDQRQTYPLLVLRQPGQCQAGGPACPMMISLHANAGTVQDSLGFWQPVASAGWVVGAAQSTQALWKGAYVWEDREQAAEEVQKHFQALVEQYHINPQKVVLAGHALGAEMAIWMSLTGVIPVKGFIAIAPTGPLTADPEQWWPLIQSGAAVDSRSYLRGYLLVGEEDETVSHENIDTLSAMLNGGNVETELEEVPLAGHDYTPEFEAGLLRALAFFDED